MIKTILSIAVAITVSGALAWAAEPSPKSSKNKKKSTQIDTAETSKMVPATSGAWTLTNNVWVHSDGYKFVNGQVVRSSPQTHKPKPKPPTQAEMLAATKKKTTPKTPAEIAAEKEALRQRNMMPRPAPQTGSHL